MTDSLTDSFRPRMAAPARAVCFRFLKAAVGFMLCASLGQAALLYTFSAGGPTPYSFSFLELSPLNTTGAFPIAPFQVDGLTFTQATLSSASGTECFQFGTPGASLTATPFSCGVSAFPPAGGWQSLFFGANGPGTYAAFNAASDGSAPAAPDKLTIRNVPAVLYTFSNAGPNGYSFSLLEPGILNATGSVPVPPFQVDGLTFTQATLSSASGTECFQFGTPGASLGATPSSCSLSAFPPDGGWQSLFFGANAFGTYSAFQAASDGSAPAAPTRLTISPTPEPAGLGLCGCALATLTALALRRRPALLRPGVAPSPDSGGVS